MALKVGYFVREASTNLRRNKLMTVAAILTAAVSLLLLGGVLTLGAFVKSVTGEIESKVEVSVFLQDGITQAQQNDVRDDAQRPRGRGARDVRVEGAGLHGVQGALPGPAGALGEHRRRRAPRVVPRGADRRRNAST